MKIDDLPFKVYEIYSDKTILIAVFTNQNHAEKFGNELLIAMNKTHSIIVTQGYLLFSGNGRVND